MSSLTPIIPSTTDGEPKQEIRNIELKDIVISLALMDPGFKKPGFHDHPKTTDFNNSQWKKICQTIAILPVLDKLCLEDVSLGKLSAEGWSQLCDAIAANHSLKHLNLSGRNFLEELDANQWQQLSDAIIANGKLNSLNFNGDFLGNSYLLKLSDKAWETLCRDIIANPQVVNLSFISGKLGTLNTARWKKLCDAFMINKNIVTLNLKYNALQSLSPENQNLFFDALISCTSLTNLNLEGNELCKAGSVFWESFSRILNSNKVMDLCLANNYLYAFKKDCWDLFCNSIRNSPSLTHLDISHNNLQESPPHRLSQFCDAVVANRSLRSLNFIKNYIHDSKYCKYFCETIIAKSSLTYLDLNAKDYSIDARAENIEAFCSALLINRRIVIDVYFPTLTSEQAQRIKKLLDTNKYYLEQSKHAIINQYKEINSTLVSFSSDLVKLIAELAGNPLEPKDGYGYELTTDDMAPMLSLAKLEIEKEQEAAKKLIIAAEDEDETIDISRSPKSDKRETRKFR